MPKRCEPIQQILARTKEAQRPSSSRNARLEMFARHWCGSILATVAECSKHGLDIDRNTAASYLRDARFIDIRREIEAAKPNAGIWTVDDLKRYWTRVASGVEQDGFTVQFVKEPVLPFEDDYNEKLGGQQWRRVRIEVPKYVSGTERTRASELLGKAQAAFLDRVEVSGDLKISVNDLLDDDLRNAKQVVDVTPKALPEASTQVVDIFE